MKKGQKPERLTKALLVLAGLTAVVLLIPKMVKAQSCYSNLYGSQYLRQK